MAPTYKELLEGLRACRAALRLGSDINSQHDARRATRLLLEMAEQDPSHAEPVAWYSGTKFYGTQLAAILGNEPNAIPLYSAPTTVDAPNGSP